MESLSQDAYKRAMAAYTQHLTAEQIKHITMPTSLSDLMTQARAMTDDLSQRRTGPSIIRNLGEKATKLEPFEKLVEGACKMCPLAKDLIWGSVSFVLQMTKDNVKAFDKVVDFFNTMTEEIESIRLQEYTFPDSPLVQTVIETLVHSILDFWVAAVVYYRSQHGGVWQMLSTFIRSSSIDKKFHSLKESIWEQRTRLHEVASTQHHAESKIHQQTERQRHLKQWLRASDYRGDLRTANERRYEGTCNWVEKKLPFVQWMSYTPSHSLFVHGIPGTGKTVLSSWAIEKAQSKGHVLYHYFRDTETDKRTPVSAIRSLIDQLFNHLSCTKSPQLSKLESALDRASLECVYHTHLVDLWKIFNDAVSIWANSEPWSVITIVLDALDECESPQPLLQDVLTLAERVKGRVKVFLTGRRSAWDLVDSIYPSTSALRPLELRITPEDIQDDISQFVRHSIHRIERLSGYEHLKERICNEIGKAENHQGMFLWAYFMCEEARRQGSVQALERLLDHLPKGLDAMYGRICKGIVERDEGLGLSLSVLKWISSSPRRLQFSELQDGLRLMHARMKGASLRGDWFDGASELLWSRQDIIDACRNLVVYTGLDKGDSFELVHLSAKQLLSCSPTQLRLPSHLESIKPFIEEISNAKLTLGTLCLEYLLSTTLHSDKYLSSSVFNSSITSASPSQSSEHDFITRYPLFNFATLQWPNFLLEGFHSCQISSPDGASLLATAKTFICDPFVVVWLEHFIRQSSIEVVVYTLHQIVEAGQSKTIEPVSSIIEWASGVIKTLDTLMRTLRRMPELVRICCGPASASGSRGVPGPSRTWQLVHDTTDIGGSTRKIPPLETGHRTWIYYNSENDQLLSIEGSSDAIRLRRQVMTTGLSLISAVAPGYEGKNVHQMTFDQTYCLHSATISPSGRLLAVAFYSYPKPAFYTVCWRLQNSAPSSTNEQPDTLLFDYSDLSHASRQTHPHANVVQAVAFRGEETLITPSYIWDFKKGQRLRGPPSILDCKSNHQHCFSGNGERFACIDNNSPYTLEIRNTLNGRTMYKDKDLNASEYADSLGREILAFSHSGKKLILCKDMVMAPRMYFCLHVDSDTPVRLITRPYESHLRSPQFTSDEETLVAHISKARYNLDAIAIWNFTKDNQGHYDDLPHMSYLLRYTDNLVFTLVPRLPQLVGRTDVITVNTRGVVSRQPLDAVVSVEEEDKLRESKMAIRHNRTEIMLESNTFNIKTFFETTDSFETTATFETWSFQSQLPRLISQTSCIIDVSIRQIRGEWMSPSGNYFVAKGRLFRLGPQAVAHLNPSQASELLEPAMIMAVAFGKQDECVAILHYESGDKCCITLTVLDIESSESGSNPLAIHHRTSLPIATFSHKHLLSNLLSFSCLAACPTDPSGYVATCPGDNMQFCRIFMINIKARKVHEFASGGFDAGDWTVVKSSVSFSYCHQHLMFKRPGVTWPHRLYLRATPEDSHTVHSFVHPTMLRIGDCYAYCPWVIRMDRWAQTGALYLARASTTSCPGIEDKYSIWQPSYQSRSLCVLPDKLIDHLDMVYLVWPEEGAGNSEVLVLVVTSGRPVLIQTGIRSGDMMNDDAWVETVWRP